MRTCSLLAGAPCINFCPARQVFPPFYLVTRGPGRRGLTSGSIRLLRNDANEPYDLVLER